MVIKGIPKQDLRICLDHQCFKASPYPVEKAYAWQSHVHHILTGTLLLPRMTSLVMLLIITDVLLASGISQHLRKTRPLQKHSPGEGHMPTSVCLLPLPLFKVFSCTSFIPGTVVQPARCIPLHSVAEQTPQRERTHTLHRFLVSSPPCFFPHTTYICRWFLVFAPRMFCFWISVLCLEQCSEIYSRWPLIY